MVMVQVLRSIGMARALPCRCGVGWDVRLVLRKWSGGQGRWTMRVQHCGYLGLPTVTWVVSVRPFESVTVTWNTSLPSTATGLTEAYFWVGSTMTATGPLISTQLSVVSTGLGQIPPHLIFPT